MSVEALRTYSFRGPASLRGQIDDALVQLEQIGEDQEIQEWLGREFRLSLLRRLTSTKSVDSGSDLVRAAVESLTEATNRVASDLKLVDEYAEWAELDIEGEEFTKAALEAGKEIWQE